MMLRLSAGVCIYVASQAIDFRKAINGLAALISEEYETPVQDGSVYVFYNRAMDRVKCLFWDKNGFVLYHKRLERSRFKMGKVEEKAPYQINPQQLDWLLAGLDFRLMSEFPNLDFSHYF